MTTANSQTARAGGRWRVARGVAALLLGVLAVVLPFVAGSASAHLVGLLLFACGVLELLQAFATADEKARGVTFLGGGLSLLAGTLLLARPVLVLNALVVLLAGSFLLDGCFRAVTAWRSRGQPARGWLLAAALANLLLGVFILIQWPLAGPQSLGVYAGLRMLASGWAMLFSPSGERGDTAPPLAGHPDRRLGLAPHPEVAKLVTAVTGEEQARRSLDRYWHFVFLFTFFAIHVGRMEAEWTLVGLFSPFVAVVGDVLFALIFALGLITPLHLAWRKLTRPLERRAWARLLARIDQGKGLGIPHRLLRAWLAVRLRFTMRVSWSYLSPRVALRRGLHVGLPWAAVMVAMSPLWAANWYFNTENWATGAWERWTEFRVDTWRTEMVGAVRELHQVEPGAEGGLFQVHPEGVAGAADFTFLVIGDPGEGDATQHALRDRYLLLGSRPDVKFLVIASDVIYPSGAMRHYEYKFYLPFKGFDKPIYAVPGNHDWYDALEAFTANFLEPEAARAAIRARVAADLGLTTTTDQHITAMIDEAARLRQEYRVQAGRQRAPYFEVQTDRFALVAVDTGILRTVDEDQLRWLRAALKRADGKFKMAILGHPLYAAGHYQAEGDTGFAALHRLLREHEVAVVMAGDTHDFEYYREPYESGGQARSMAHFVNGGGGAYLSIGTALAWPERPAVADCAFYPRTDALVARIDRQTPAWKQPLWFWTKRLGGWPSSPEGLAAAFDSNRAPFFQSFMEVRVSGTENVVRLLLHGVHGPLRWRDLQLHGQVMPAGKSEDDPVEFTVAMPAGAGR